MFGSGTFLKTSSDEDEDSKSTSRKKTCRKRAGSKSKEQESCSSDRVTSTTSPTLIEEGTDSNNNNNNNNNNNQYLYRISHFSCTTAINMGPGVMCIYDKYHMSELWIRNRRQFFLGFISKLLHNCEDLFQFNMGPVIKKTIRS